MNQNSRLVSVKVLVTHLAPSRTIQSFAQHTFLRANFCSMRYTIGIYLAYVSSFVRGPVRRMKDAAFCCCPKFRVKDMLDSHHQ